LPDNKLVLHPVNPRAILQDPPLLLEALRKAGLVGAAFSHVGELHYRAGPRFGALVAFRSTTPGDLSGFHVALLETTEEPTFLGASNTQPPECRHCQAKLADWRTQLLAWQKARQRYLWSCPGCAKKFDFKELAWGATGGIGRYSLDLWNIGQDEAVPSAELLALLRDETLESWRYFYYRF